MVTGLRRDYTLRNGLLRGQYSWLISVVQSVAIQGQVGHDVDLLDP